MKIITHDFRVGDVVTRKDGKEGRFVVSGTKGWVHTSFRHEDGRNDAWISLCKSMGEISELAHASEYKIFMRRQEVDRNKWWTIFPKGEK